MIDDTEMNADDYTAQSLHSALDACLAEDTEGHEKAKKMAKLIKAMHEGKERAVDGGNADETPEQKKEREDKEKATREEQLRNTFTERMEQTATLAEPQIDRERGILKHVHIAGMVSRTDGARYRMEGHRKASPRFEQMPVGLDHDYSGAPMKVGQAWGILSNITLETDGPYGDLAYLKSHERTEQVLEDAERKTGIFSLSMVAKTRGRDPLDIEEYIPSRVDLVVRGATTRTLFNQEHPAVSKEQYDALAARFEQLAAKCDALEKRLDIKEKFVTPQARLEQEIERVEKTVAATIDLRKFWDTSIPAGKS